MDFNQGEVDKALARDSAYTQSIHPDKYILIFKEYDEYPSYNSYSDLIHEYNKMNIPKKIEGFECPKCKQTSVIVRSVQTRSADEGQTVFRECTNKSCGYREKANT